MDRRQVGSDLEWEWRVVWTRGLKERDGQTHTRLMSGASISIMEQLTEVWFCPPQITLYVNKVGPYFNPQETYHYYSLPVCHPEKVGEPNQHIATWNCDSNYFSSHLPLLFNTQCTTWQIEHRSLTLGEVLDGDRMAVSLYEINFKGKIIVQCEL